MVFYHTINYFATIGYDGTKYLRFVTGSFIFISGYIVAVFYQHKYLLNRIATSKRLVTRGFKILIIYTSLNLLINLLNIQTFKAIQYDIDSFLTNLDDIYLKGNSLYAAFQILVPIAYLLILSPLLLFWGKWKKTIIASTAILLSAHVLLNISSFNLYGLLIGLFGLSIGLLSIDQNAFSIKSKSLIIVLFCLSIIMMPFFDKNILLYAIGLTIIMKLVFDFSKLLNLDIFLNKLVILLGRYSLLSYLMQIFFLQGMYQLFLKKRFDLGYELLLIIFITNIFLIVLCSLIDLLRHKFILLNRLYKLVFA